MVFNMTASRRHFDLFSRLLVSMFQLDQTSKVSLCFITFHTVFTRRMRHAVASVVQSSAREIQSKIVCENSKK